MAELLPWREVIVPHQDVLEGSFEEASFAADLTKVVRGVASPEYQDPERFFERTVITEGMGLLLQSVLKRLSGKGGDPVVQLQTAFGGGKTHTMMAVLHVASGKAPAKKMLGVPELLDKAKVEALVRAKIAVLDGGALGPSQPRKHGKQKVHTLWGEIAYQLGGEDGYELVAASDRDGTSPGKDLLAELFERYAPVVVLIDETVAYLRQLQPGKSYAGGTFNSNLSFFQALTEAAARVPNAMVLASLPESTMEVGDQLAQDALDAVQKIFGRIEAVWKPVATEEAFEIVRRRLFGPVQNERAREAACRAFAELYAQEADKFPADTRNATYQRRLLASYPIHPEVFERLYEDWSTLPKFQRTRGVLRLMARLIHSLWREDNRDLMVMPGSLPLDDVDVRNELIKHLPAGWDPIVDKDVDGPNAEPREVDVATPALGSMQACRRCARTIFLGSAPSVGAQKVRGIGVERVRLGCAQPGQSVSKYDDALRRLGDRLHYLYSGNDRYWFDLRPNLRREMEDRMQRFDPHLHLHHELELRLQDQIKKGLFGSVHVFAQSKDIGDTTDLRLVVLEPDHAHKRKEAVSKAILEATEILEKHGDKPREHRNRLLFLVADSSATHALLDQLRRYLAWDSIVDDTEELNLDQHHQKEAKKNRDEAARRLEGSIRETYRMMLVPMQDPDAPGGFASVLWEDEALSLSGGASFDKEIERVAREREWVVQTWAPPHLRGLLARWFWKDERPSVSAQKVWLDTCRYLYLPRLQSRDVFTRTIADGVLHEDFFAYATGEKEGDRYEGLLFGSPGGVYMTDTALLVRPDAAAAARAASSVTGATAGGPGARSSSSPPSGGSGVSTSGPPPSSRSPGRLTGVPLGPEKKHHRFHATVSLDAKDPIGSFAEVVQNVVEHLTSQYGTDVTLSLDIEAKRPDGFETKTVRVVRENASHMKFKTAEFEDE